MDTNTETVKSTNTNDTKAPSVNSMLDQVSAVAHPAIDQWSAKVHDSIDKLTSAANHGADNLEARTEQLSATTERFGQAVREQLQQHPVMVLGAAVASGFILSWLLKSRAG